MITYSFIIPHKNSPELLNRCLNSIPSRDDIQIIVVDDNSDEGKKPSIDRSNVELVLLNAEHSKGAGRARNVGLEKAKGKWILFADSDDFYTENFLLILDEYKKSDYEVIVFSCEYVDSVSLDILPKPKSLKCIDQYDGSKDLFDRVRYKTNVPWGKMISRDYILNYNMRYEEIPRGNDIFFSYQIGYYSNKLKIDKRRIYVYTFNKSSITNGQKSLNLYKQSFINVYKCNSFISFLGYHKWKESMFRYFISILKRESLRNWMKIVWMFMSDYKEIVSEKNLYVDYFELHNKKSV